MVFEERRKTEAVNFVNVQEYVQKDTIFEILKFVQFSNAAKDSVERVVV